ncbi:uncharacterized protein TNCV_4929281 [Trichonephila clavipes]|nr:uncharacterized protein TNCV_4929281 [Trichonephila clavipes]
METFGYLVCDSCSPGEFLYIHPSLFLNIIDCVQNVVLRKDISDKIIVYFKILNSSEIVQYIHNDAQEECFGFRQLHRTDQNDKFKVFSPNKHLFVNLLDCVLEARDITSDEDRKKLKRGFVEEEEEEYPNVSPKKSVKKGKPQNIFDLDLSPPSSGSHEVRILPYLGKGAKRVSQKLLHSF